MIAKPKLYKVTCRGLYGSIYRVSYVLAEDPTIAYKKVKNNLDRRNIGFPPERELQSIELIADTAEFPDCGIILYS